MVWNHESRIDRRVGSSSLSQQNSRYNFAEPLLEETSCKQLSWEVPSARREQIFAREIVTLSRTSLAEISRRGRQRREQRATEPEYHRDDSGARIWRMNSAVPPTQGSNVTQTEVARSKFPPEEVPRAMPVDSNFSTPIC